jgi:DNA adenine methylase
LATHRRNHYYEICLGGGKSIIHLAPHFKHVHAGDVHEDLMLMWQAAANGWIPPSMVSEEEYQRIRREPASALRGFAGFGCSFGGKWWGGYARNKTRRNYAQSASKQVQTIASLMKSCDVELRIASFQDWKPEPDSVVYADPPYRGTTAYHNKFNSDFFWKTMEEWSRQGVQVFVSEYTAPPHWKSIWTMNKRRTVSGGTGSMTTEHLFTI